MRRWVGQDLSLLMTLKRGKNRCVNDPVLPKFSRKVFTEIFESLNFNCVCYPNSKISVLYLLSLSFIIIIVIIVIKNQSKKSDRIKTS